MSRSGLGGGSDDPSQDQGVAIFSGGVFDGVTARKFEATFLNGHDVGQLYGLVSQIGLILAHGRNVGYFLQGL